MGGKKGISIAVLDDDAGMCQAVSRLLDAAGYSPISFLSGDAYLRAKPSPPPACIVLDIHMPGRSGFEVLEALRRSASDLPAIFITAHDEPGTRDQAQAAGCVAYLRKPFSGHMLLGAIETALSGSGRNITGDQT